MRALVTATAAGSTAIGLGIYTASWPLVIRSRREIAVRVAFGFSPAGRPKLGRRQL